MEMSNEEIKKEVEKINAQIASADERLVELRNICQHEKTFKGNYSWRPGVIQMANICEYCGEVVSKWPI